MPRTKKEIVLLVIGLLVSPFANKGQCDRVKEEEADFIIFPKAFFSSDTDHVKRFLSGNSLIVHTASGGTQWHQWNNSYYAFVTSDLTWEDAMEGCRSFCEGAHLVFIESDQENREVSRMAVEVSGQQRAPWWIGLNDKDKENSWKWDETPVNYTNWIDREPNGNKTENCGEFRRWRDGNAFWNDRRCYWKNYFICEKDVNSEL